MVPSSKFNLPVRKKSWSSICWRNGCGSERNGCRTDFWESLPAQILLPTRRDRVRGQRLGDVYSGHTRTYTTVFFLFPPHIQVFFLMCVQQLRDVHSIWDLSHIQISVSAVRGQWLGDVHSGHTRIYTDCVCVCFFFACTIFFWTCVRRAFLFVGLVPHTNMRFSSARATAGRRELNE